MEHLWFVRTCTYLRSVRTCSYQWPVSIFTYLLPVITCTFMWHLRTCTYHWSVRTFGESDVWKQFSSTADSLSLSVGVCMCGSLYVWNVNFWMDKWILELWMCWIWTYSSTWSEIVLNISFACFCECNLLRIICGDLFEVGLHCYLWRKLSIDKTWIFLLKVTVFLCLKEEFDF